MTFVPISVVFFWFLAYPIGVAFSIMFVMTPLRYVFVLVARLFDIARGIS